MKNSPLTTILLAVLTVSALLSLYLCWLLIAKGRELRSLQATVGQIESNRRLASALAADALEYSKKNAAIDPILEAANLKPKSGAASTNKPGTK